MNKKSNLKLIIYIVLILVLMGALYLEISLGSSRLKARSIAYTKTGSINYVTYMKDKTYHADDYNFVANLIDYFNVDYDYAYVLSEPIKYKLEYDVVGVLEVYDIDNDSKPVEKKTYQLYDKLTEENTAQVIKVNIFIHKIDYATYNNVVQEWKKEISPNATLRVTINVKWSGFSETLNREISDTYTSSFNIPISDKTINIVSPNNTDTSGMIKNDDPLNKGLIIIVASTILLLVTIIVCFIMWIVGNSKKRSKYEAKINKILREFDRAITEAKGNFTKEDDYNYIEVKEFMELMDVHDNINEPIIYYRNTDNMSVFAVRNNNDVYYWIIKRSEYDNN